MRVWIDVADQNCRATMFGITMLERILRTLAKHEARIDAILVSGPSPENLGVKNPKIIRRAESGNAPSRVARALDEAHQAMLVIDGATLIDPRLLAVLLDDGPAVAALGGEGKERAGLLRLTPRESGTLAAQENAATVCVLAEALVASGSVPLLSKNAVPNFIPDLRRSIDYWLFAAPDAPTRAARGRWMFQSNYKGSTDFLTRWVYPPIVWPMVRAASALRIHPNWITALSVVLAFGVIPLFMKGDFFLGLALGYLMTILDSVDGKVARLTLTASPIGTVLDHGLDIVHPPLWYLAWAWGLGARPGDFLFSAALALIGFYVLDRLVLGVAKHKFKRGLHAVTALDGAVRTWIARRNVNMAIFTVGLIAGQGAAGFLAVVLWQGLTLLWHSWRTAILPRAAAQRV